MNGSPASAPRDDSPSPSASPTPGRPPAALILFSHGSLLCGAGETLRRHAERLALSHRDQYRTVEVRYLNYTDPPFETAVERCRAAGARRIVVAPYFLVAGKFVKTDLPRRIEQNRLLYPDLEFILADAVLDAPGMPDVILEEAAAARPPSRWRDDLNAAPSFCQSRPDCPLFNTPACPATPGATTEADAPVSAPPPLPNPEARPASAQDPARTALLVMVHGSPRPESNDDVLRILEKVRERGLFDRVQPAFMECNEPDIPAAIDLCVAAGAGRIVAVPYFLHTGCHVADDLPGLLEQARDRHPAVEFLMSTYIGTSPRITDILASRALQAEQTADRA